MQRSIKRVRHLHSTSESLYVGEFGVSSGDSGDNERLEAEMVRGDRARKRGNSEDSNGGGGSAGAGGGT